MTIVSEHDIKSLVKQAIHHHQVGELVAAEHLYRKILNLKSNQTFASDKIKQIYPLILTEFGTVLQKQIKYDEAVQVYQSAILLKPELIDVYNNLGTVFKEQEKFEKAIHTYQQALKVNPNWAEGYNKIGSVFQAQENLEQAQKYYQKAIQVNPQFASAYNNLGTIFKEQGKLEEAVQVYQRAIQINPQFAEAYQNLGNIFKQQDQLAESIQCYQKALAFNFNLVEAHYNLATALQRQGKSEEAIQRYQQTLNLNPQFYEAEFGICMSQLPIIYSSVDEIQRRREQYQQFLQSLAKKYQELSVTEQIKAAKAVGTLQPFYLAYQGLNDKTLQQTYGEMIHQLMASRYPQYSQPLSMPELQPGEKIRVGFVSGYFNHHSVWKIPIKGWVENLDQNQFELFGYHTSFKQDAQTASAKQAFVKFIQGPLLVEQWAKTIIQDQLHILIFPEFGMDPMTIQLGCLKLAAVQMVFGGHPETSGLTTIDYHLSSDLMEPDNGQDHYTEKLIRLPNLAVHYTPLKIEAKQITKKDIGIKDDQIMFWSCQSLFKYLPQHDDVFPRITQEFGNCKFVFIRNESEQWTDVFRHRLSRGFEEVGLDYQDYCIFLPRLKAQEFAGTTAIADVFLDNIGWSGNNTTMESCAYNIPIVTWPGDLMRGRHTAAILKMMGLTELIASNKDEYIQLAVRLASDLNYRQAISQHIAENKHKIYQDLAPVKALETFLKQAVFCSQKKTAEVEN